MASPKRKAVLLFFLLILLWQVAFNTLLLPQHSFRKYSVNALKFLEHPVPDERLLDFSPLYLALHVGINAAGIPSWSVVPFLQILLSVLSLFLLYRTLLGRVSLGAAAGAVLLAALYPAYNLYTFCQEPELLLFFLNILGLYYTLARPSPLGGGLAFTLAVLTRPSVFPLAFLAGLFQRSRRWLYYFLLACGILVLLGVSWWAAGSPTLSYMSPGTVFYEGNNPHAAGVASMYPPVIKLWENAIGSREADYAHVLYRRASAFETGRTLPLTSHQVFWIRKALRWAWDHPLAWARLTAGKAWSALGNREVHDIISLVLVEERMGGMRAFGFGLFAALALTGLLAFRGRIPALIWIGAGWTSLTLLLFYFTSRQRMGLFAFVLFLTAFGLEAIRRNKGWLLSATAVLAFTLWTPFPVASYLGTFSQIQASGHLREEVSRDIKRQQWDRASVHMAECIREAPFLAPYHSSPFLAFEGGNPFAQALRLKERPIGPYELGLLYFGNGMYGRALEVFESIRRHREQRHFYAVEPPLYYIAVCQARLGRTEESLAAVEEARRRFPGNGPVMALADAAGKPQDLLRYHDLLSASWYRGRALFHLARYAEALPHFERIVQAAPELLTAREYLAICHARTGNFQGMAEELSALVSRNNEASLIPQWQDITREMEARFSGDPLYADLLTRMRILFPPPLPQN